MNQIVNSNHGLSMVPQSLEQAMRLADMMARGKLVPQHLRDSPSDCLMVVEQALRWQMSPFAVAQCTGIVKGKLSYEGKLVAAAIHTSGILSGRLDYKFSGSGDDRKVIASGLLRGETAPREVEVTLKSARTDNEHWKKSPDQMLTYHSARVWARRHAPEVMLGVYSPEEFDAPQSAVPQFTGTTIEAEPERPTIGQQIGDSLPDHSAAPKRKTWAELLGEIEESFRTSYTREEVDQTLSSDQVQKALDTARNGTREKLDALIKVAMDRTATIDDGSAATDDAIFPGDRPSQTA